MAIQLELLLFESVSLVAAMHERDYEEARFRVRQVEDIAWADNNSRLGNAAINLEVALRDAGKVPEGAADDMLDFLLTELEDVLRPLQGG